MTVVVVGLVTFAFGVQIGFLYGIMRAMELLSKEQRASKNYEDYKTIPERLSARFVRINFPWSSGRLR